MTTEFGTPIQMLEADRSGTQDGTFLHQLTVQGVVSPQPDHRSPTIAVSVFFPCSCEDRPNNNYVDTLAPRPSWTVSTLSIILYTWLGFFTIKTYYVKPTKLIFTN